MVQVALVFITLINENYVLKLSYNKTLWITISRICVTDPLILCINEWVSNLSGLNINLYAYD